MYTYDEDVGVIIDTKGNELEEVGVMKEIGTPKVIAHTWHNVYTFIVGTKGYIEITQDLYYHVSNKLDLPEINMYNSLDDG